MFGSSYVNKIFIDSRFKTPESNSDSDFTIELSENIELADNIGCIVTDVTIPHTWFNINQLNNGLYFRYDADDYQVRLPAKNYNIYELATGIQAVMNEAVGDNIFEVSANV